MSYDFWKLDCAEDYYAERGVPDLCPECGEPPATCECILSRHVERHEEVTEDVLF